jgi:hypothetical protein
MNVYLAAQDVTATDNYIGAVSDLLDRLEQVDVNSVSLTWPVFTDGRRSSEVFAGAETPSIDALAAFSAAAKARGFGVMFHPILDEAAIAILAWKYFSSCGESMVCKLHGTNGGVR